MSSFSLLLRPDSWISPLFLLRVKLFPCFSFYIQISMPVSGYSLYILVLEYLCGYALLWQAAWYLLPLSANESITSSCNSLTTLLITTSIIAISEHLQIEVLLFILKPCFYFLLALYLGHYNDFYYGHKYNICKSHFGKWGIANYLL